jgi:hypothetical protein
VCRCSAGDSARGWERCASAATVPLLAALGVVWGLGDGLVVPAEAGLVPQTVSPARLQQANARSTVLLFGVANVFFMFLQVLGPAVAQERLGGAGAWAAILTAAGIGAIAGGVAALRQHPCRPLIACVLWPFAILPQFAALAAGALLVGNLTMLLIPAVWGIEARQPEGVWLRSAT